MLTHYLKKPHVINRILKSYFGYLFEPYILHLHQRGYKPETIKVYCQCVEHFGQWLKNKKISKKTNFKTKMNYFLKNHLPICNCPIPRSIEKKSIRAAVNQLLKIFDIGKSALSTPNSQTTKSNRIVNLFCEYLSDICGLAENTVINRRHYVMMFLNKFQICNLSQVEMISPKQVSHFIKNYSCYYKSSSLGVVLTSLRSFFKYLLFHGYNVKNLISSVPIIPNWKLSSVPQILTDNQIKLFLSVFNCKFASGKRDYAMVRCFTDLGLRCCEVAKVRIKDINWYDATLRIATGKSEKEDQLPLPKALGQAISDYLIYGRPKSKSEFVFVFHRAPLGEKVNVTTVRSAIRRAFQKAGIYPIPSPHILRHSFATKLLTSGASLKEIADILRHRCIDTTAIYTKIDLPHLRYVCMPWFGRKS